MKTLEKFLKLWLPLFTHKWLERAEGLYEEACRLNPGHAESWYSLGKVRVE